MREIRFRGKRLDNGEWVYGFFYQVNQRHAGGLLSLDSFIITPDNKRFNIDSETIGQFTGLRDKNGREIWEGDILRQGFCTTSRGYEDETYTGYHIGAVIILASQGVCMRKPLCHLDDTGDTFISSQYKRVAAYRCEVIGNRWDNPNLLGDTP